MPAAQKSPLHPSALHINDLNPGRTIVWFNQGGAGILGVYIVLERPVVRSVVQHGDDWRAEDQYVVSIPPGARVIYRNTLVVKLRDVATGISRYQYLEDLGVVAYEKRFNRVNFVVDHRKRHLLSTETGLSKNHKRLASRVAGVKGGRRRRHR